MSLLAIVVSKDVLQYDAVTEQLARVDELLLVGTLDGGRETKTGHVSVYRKRCGAQGILERRVGKKNKTTRKQII